MENSINLKDLLFKEIVFLYKTKKQQTTRLTGIVGEFTDQRLRKALDKYLKETHEQIQRLEKVLFILEPSKQCEALRETTEDSNEKDNKYQIVANLHDVKYDEILAYTTAYTYADLIGQQEVEGLLYKNIEAEKELEKDLKRLSAKLNENNGKEEKKFFSFSYRSTT